MKGWRTSTRERGEGRHTSVGRGGTKVLSGGWFSVTHTTRNKLKTLITSPWSWRTILFVDFSRVFSYDMSVKEVVVVAGGGQGRLFPFDEWSWKTGTGDRTVVQRHRVTWIGLRVKGWEEKRVEVLGGRMVFYSLEKTMSDGLSSVNHEMKRKT